MTTQSEHDDKIIPIRFGEVADILYAAFPDKKILATKILRSVSGLGLRESKAAIDAAAARMSAANLRARLVAAAVTGDDELLVQLAANLRAIEKGE